MARLSERFQSFLDRITGENRYAFTCIGFLCVMVYANSLDVPFYFDDYSYIVQNPFIRSFGGIFDKDLILGTPLYEDIKNSVISRPLSYITFALNFAIHQTSVSGYHLFNIAIHLVNSCLIQSLVLLTFLLYSEKKYLRDKSHDIKAVVQRIAFFTAAIFAVHPVMTNAVTYVVQRMASLATLFYLLTMVLYARYCLSDGKTARITWYLLSITSCVAAMKSKEIAFTLPLMLVVYDSMFCRGNFRERSQRLLPFILCVVVVIAFGGCVDGVGKFDLQNNGQPSTQQVVSFAKASPLKYLTTQFVTNLNSTSIVSMSPLEYLFTQVRVVATYQRMLLLPIGLNLIHDYHFYRSFLEPAVILSLGIHLLILSSAFFMFRRSGAFSGGDAFMFRMAAFGVVWFYLSSAMECGIIPMDDLLLEHRMYLPSFGFLVAVVSLMQIAAWRGIPAFLPTNMLLVVIILMFSTLTIFRNEQWRDPLVFWQDALSKSPKKMRIHAYLGNVYQSRGDIPKSFQEMKLAFSGDYPYAEDHIVLGNLFLENRMYSDAVDEYLMALKMLPDKNEVYYSLAEAYRLAGNKRLSDRALQKAAAGSPLK